MSTNRPPSNGTPSRPNRARKAPEPRKNPLRKPKGISFLTITACLAVLLVITLVQAACGSAAATPAASSSASASAAPTVAPAPSTSAGAASSASASPASASASTSASGAPSASASGSAKPAASIQRTYSSPPPMTIDVNKKYTATIQTEKGKIVMQLDPQLAPVTVNNFVFLAEHHFYDGLTWHRVVAGFVIQGGDPTGTGSGGPGYTFKDEPVKGKYTAGCVAMANSGPNTNGSQFFICTADDTQKLQPLYNLFGYVTQGLDVAQKIQVGDHMQKVTIS